MVIFVILHVIKLCCQINPADSAAAIFFHDMSCQSVYLRTLRILLPNDKLVGSLYERLIRPMALDAVLRNGYWKNHTTLSLVSSTNN